MNFLHTLHISKTNTSDSDQLPSFKSDTLHPGREWVLGLAVAALVLVGVGIFSAYTFNTSNTVFYVPTEPADTVVPYRASLIKTALEEYQDLEDQYNAALQNTVMPVIISDTSATTTEPNISTTTDSITSSETPDPVPSDATAEPPSLAI